VCEIGCVNHVAVLSRTRQMYHMEGEVNDRGKRMSDCCLERMTLKVGHTWIQGFRGG